MFLFFRFIPGESVTIGGVAFGVEFSPPSLTRPDRLSIPIGADPVRLPKAEVRLSGRQRPGSLAIAFRAPRDVLIVRMATENVL